jgi:hypothetical protein
MVRRVLSTPDICTSPAFYYKYFSSLLTSSVQKGRASLNGEDNHKHHILIDICLLSIYLSICVSIYLSICLSVYLSIYKFIYLSIYLSICLSVYLSIYLSIYLSVYLSIYLSVCLSIYLSVCLSIYLSPVAPTWSIEHL